MSTQGIVLSPEQRAVVTHRGSPLQVIACAGSGKTESISRRIASLISEGIPPEAIVAFTFTERAASELKQRVVKHVEESMGSAYLDRLGPMFVGTIHGYCFRVLQDHVPHYGNHDVLDEHRHAGLLSREYKNLGLSRLGSQHWRPIRDFMRTVDVIGNELIDPASLSGDVGDCYRVYREMLERYHFLTFSLLISLTVEALKDEVVYRKVHAPLRHLIVDEYQDVNPAQERLIELLAKDPVELCVVGDDDQSIYQWRGSDVTNILDFTRRRPSTTTHVLDINRRSRPTIVTTANDFATSIPHRLTKQMISVRPPSPCEVVPWSAETDSDEADIIVETIRRLHNEGYRYRDMAVLYRSVRTSAPLLIDALKSEGIPFSCGGRTGLFLQQEIAFFGETFAWLADCDWRDERYGTSRKADLNSVVAGLDQCFGNGSQIDGLRKYLQDWKSYHLSGSHTVSLVGDFYKLLFKLGADAIDIDTPQGSARFGAFARFTAVLADYEHVNRRGRYVEEGGQRIFRSGRDRGVTYLRGLANYLLHYAQDAYEDFDGELIADVDAVDILTVHQSKGLEWPIVFMPALVDRRFPPARSGVAQTWLLSPPVFPNTTRLRYEGGDAEERRLFYVAITRARDSLYLSTFNRKTNRFRPSPYLLEVAKGQIPRLDPLPLPGASGGTSNKESPPLEIAFSDVATFDECGYRYRLGAVMGFQQELAIELGYGKAIHHVLRQVAEAARGTGKIPQSSELQQLIDHEFYLPFATIQAYESMHKAATRLVHAYVTDYSQDLQRVWAIERPFELHLDDGTVTGRADIILDEEGGRPGALALVDYKVAHDPIRDERYHLQLAVYTAAARGEGLEVEAAYLHELRDGTRRDVDIGEVATANAVDTVARSVRDIRAGVWTAKPGADRCRTCDFPKLCRHRAGT